MTQDIPKSASKSASADPQAPPSSPEDGFSYGTGVARVRLETPLFLAPMAGSTELAFRSICRSFGCGQGVTELVSARGIRHGGLEPHRRYLAVDPSREGPVAIQLFGFDPQDFEVATERILNDPLYAQIVAIDINMGCPVRKVRKTGAGVSLMENPALAAAIVRATKRVAERYAKPVSVKFRSGVEKGGEAALGAPAFALVLAEAGADLLSLHARTAEQFYRGEADWSLMPEVRRRLDMNGFAALPLVGNGDIDSAESLRKRMALGACEAYMIGRAAAAAPWIFAELRAALDGRTFTSPTTAERCDVIRRHFEGLKERLGEEHASREFRSLLVQYIKGCRNAASYRGQANRIASAEDLNRLCARLEADGVWGGSRSRVRTNLR